MMDDVTASGDSERPGGKPADAGKPAPVAAKAAAIDAAQAHPLTWKTVVKRALAVAVAGAAIYLVLPSLIAVLGAWPRLSTLSPAWFAVAIAAELVSFICNFALQRLALRTRGWFAVVTAGLTGNTVTDSLPGGDAAGAAVQFRMLTTAGFDTDTAVGGLTAFSLLGVGGLLALPLFALPTTLGGAAVSPGLVHTALLGLAGFVLYAIFGVILLGTDRPLATVGRGAEPVEQGHPRQAAGDRPGPAAAGRTRHDQGGAGPQMAAGDRADCRPARLRLRLPAGRAARHRSQPAAVPGAAGLRRRRHHRAVPAHPGRAGHRGGQPQRAADPGRRPPGYAVLATLAYRIAFYWLPLLAGLPAYLLFRHRYGRPAPRRATPGEADQPSAGS